LPLLGVGHAGAKLAKKENAMQNNTNKPAPRQNNKQGPNVEAERSPGNKERMPSRDRADVDQGDSAARKARH
jgi:hypothetical protein